MKRFDLYIGKTVLFSALAALIVLVVLESFVTLLTELGNLGDDGYGLYELGRYIVYSLPKSVYVAVPVALLLGGLLGMGGLAASSELTAMRAAGLSKLGITVSCLKAGLLVSVLSMVLGEWLAPAAERQAERDRAEARGENLDLRSGAGFWARSNGNIVNVKSVAPGVGLGEVLVYELNEQGALTGITQGKSARHSDAGWLLQEVSRDKIGETQGRANGDQAQTITGLNPDMLPLLAADPDELSLSELRTYTAYLNENGLDNRRYLLEMWSKIFAPLANLAMLFIAMQFVFSSQRSGGAGQRILVGVVLGLAFFLLNKLLGNFVLLFGWPPIMGALLPSVLLMTVGVLVMRRQA